jgi:hypothetical protein
MEHKETLSYGMSGDLGDVIYSMRICHQLNDPNSTYYLVDRPFTKAWNQARLDALTPLMEAQPYLGRVVYGEPQEKLTHDFIDFRRGGLPFARTLGDIHADWVGVKLEPYKPWLFVKPSEEFAGKIVVHKSPRYNNPQFPWKQLAAKFGHKMVAVGVSDEHAVICGALGLNIPLRKTTSYLELAELIAGADLFIGNQSSPCAIALGLGVPAVQETCLRQPDCIIERANTYYGWGSEVVIDGISYGMATNQFINKDIVPPGGWIVTTDNGNKYRSTSIGMVSNDVMRELGIDRKTAEKIILEQNTKRVRIDYPTFQKTKESDIVEKIIERGCIQNVKTNLKYH